MYGGAVGEEPAGSEMPSEQVINRVGAQSPSVQIEKGGNLARIRSGRLVRNLQKTPENGMQPQYALSTLISTTPKKWTWETTVDRTGHAG